VRKLILHTRIFLTADIICAAGLTALLIFRPVNWTVFAVLILAAGALAASFFHVARKKLKDVKDIIETTVIHIPFAVINAQSAEEKEEAEKIHKNTSIYVSCFGILIGTQVIKFNRDGVKLKAVEIGKNYISFDYGAGADTHNIRLLYSKPGEDELAELVEEFRKVTGVIPVLA